MSDALQHLTDIVQRSLDAAGIHDADPSELPERIAELRFVGTMFVPNEAYPRSNQSDQRRAQPESAPGRAPRLDRSLKSLSGYMG